MDTSSAAIGKLVQYLNEAYGKERELETALQAHIEMTSSAPYKKRLRQHLTETKRHARETERRIKQLGGTAQDAPIEGLSLVGQGANAVVEIVGRASAAMKAPLHMIRGTGEQERMLKNAKSEYADEHEEIATYTAIVRLAEALKDGETAKLARAILRDEQSMARFLEQQIPLLVNEVMEAEIPSMQTSTSGSVHNTRPAGRRTSRAKPKVATAKA